MKRKSTKLAGFFSKYWYLFFVLFVVSSTTIYLFKNSLLFFAPKLTFPPNTNIVKATSGGFAFENKTNVFETQFKDDYTAEDGIVFNNRLGKISFYTPKKQSFGDLITSAPLATGSSLSYENIFEGLDLRYTISGSRLLEEFILEDKTTADQVGRIEQKARTNNSFKQNDDGSISFFDNKEKLVFSLPKPIMYELDDKTKVSDGLIYEVSGEKNNLTITKVVTAEGKEWLMDKNRKYPVAIDLVIDNADDVDTTYLSLDNGDSVAAWTSSNQTTSPISQETSIKQEGSGSIKTTTTATLAGLTLDLMEYSSDSNAQAAFVTNGRSLATGGTVTYTGNDVVHTFTSNGTFTPSVSSLVTQALLVGGGGGGGGAAGGTANAGGGGGGGGVVYNASVSLTNSSYPITVGNGGNGGAGYSTRVNGDNGGNSSFNAITANGGGGGGSGNNASGNSGANGGGGGSEFGAGGTGTAGYSGGQAAGCGGCQAGGGGGAGGVGSSPGNGGIGYLSTISGASVYYSGGGGGGSWYSNPAPGTGGTGGGGNGNYGEQVGYSGTSNTGGGGGGGGGNSGGAGGSGVVIVRYTAGLQSFSEASIKTQGSYSLKGIAQATTSLNKTLTKTIASPLNLSGYTTLSFDIRASRTGSNIKIGLRDSGGTTTEITPNITQADVFQTVNLDISAVSNTNKDAIDQIIITIINADATNTFYIDNMTVTAPNSFGDTVTKTVQPTNLSNVAFITYRVYSTVAGTYATFGFGESAATEQTQSITINQANTWETKTFDLSGISGTARDAVTKFAFTFNADTSGATFYFDDIQSNQLFTPTIGTATAQSTSSIRWGFTDNALDETAHGVYDTGNNLLVTCNGGSLTYCDETGLQINTQYTRKVAAIKSGIGRGYFSGTVSKYTLANVPGSVNVARSATSAQFTLSANGNPANTEYAVYKDTGDTCDGSGGSYLNTNGTENGGTAVWATFTNWGSAGTITASSLGREQKHTFCVKARNGDNIETGFSGIGSSNTGEIIPISGNYTINTNTATNFVTRYRDGSNPSRYIIGLDNVGANGLNSSEITIQGGSVTVNSNETLVAGKMNFTGGTLFLASGGGQLAPGARLWTIDRDQDGFPDTLGGEIKVWYGTSSTPTSTVSASYFRRKALLSTLAVADCNDNAYSTINSCCSNYTYYLDADGDSYGSTTTNILCQETPVTPPGYVTNNTDCNDNNVNRWRLLPGYVDSDGDTYGAGAQQNVCSGNSLLNGYVANNLDCNDTTATITTITATGGTISNLTGYKVHTFTSSGTFNITCGSASITYLVVGGGRGGYNFGSGGAGGQVMTGSLSLTAGAHTVTVGGGGASNGGVGGNSVFSSITSNGATSMSGYGDTLSPPAGGTYSSINGSNTLYGIYGAASTVYGGGWNCAADSGGPYAGYGYTGVPNTGGGGSAGDCRGSGEGCAAICTGFPGGSGIVIVRYQVP